VVKVETKKSFKTRRLAKDGRILEIWPIASALKMKTVSLL
jgi:hypothetical protein